MRQEWHDERRNKIRMALMDLYRKEGWQSVSIKKVARNAGIAVGTVYNYFPSKLSLLADFFMSKIQSGFSHGNCCPQTMEEWIHACFAIYTSFSREEWKMFMVFIYSEADSKDYLIWESQSMVFASLKEIICNQYKGPEEKCQCLIRTCFAVFFQGFQRWIHTEVESQKVVDDIYSEVECILSSFIKGIDT